MRFSEPDCKALAPNLLRRNVAGATPLDQAVQSRYLSRLSQTAPVISHNRSCWSPAGVVAAVRFHVGDSVDLVSGVSRTEGDLTPAVPRVRPRSTGSATITGVCAVLFRSSWHLRRQAGMAQKAAGGSGGRGTGCSGHAYFPGISPGTFTRIPGGPGPGGAAPDFALPSNPRNAVPYFAGGRYCPAAGHGPRPHRRGMRFLAGLDASPGRVLLSGVCCIPVIAGTAEGFMMNAAGMARGDSPGLVPSSDCRTGGCVARFSRLSG